MQRHSIAPRSNWQSKLERLGFDYHSMDGSYWQEDSCYRFDSSEIDLIEDASNELHQMCLDTIDFIISQDRFAVGHTAHHCPLDRRQLAASSAKPVRAL